MARIQDIIERVRENFPDSDTAVLQQAYVYSAMVHEGQSRLSGEAYLTHPLAVAEILAEMRLDPVTVAAGLLHDTVEDTNVSEAEIQERFGERIAHLVAGLTKLAKVEFHSREEQQAENFRKMLVAMSKDIRVLLIKLADRLHNMRTLEYMPEDARRRTAQETLDIYSPLAHRLGMYNIKSELEDRAFRELYPEGHKQIQSKLQGSRKQRERYVELVRTKLQSVLDEAGLRAEVTGRTKELYSTFRKMRTQELEIDQVYDLTAFRVIVDGTKATCYETLGIVHATWRPVPGRIKDYIAMPKPNGYQSIHTSVIGPYGERMEVQIRTQEMHRVAELGIAAHWKYKEGVEINPEHEQQFAWLRQLLEWQQQLDNPNEFLETVRVDLFADEVYVFTPKGDVFALPAGASSIDFAYAVHSEVGSHCAGAKVNGKLVPLRTRLENGDTVEIITSPHQKPRREWLDAVVTGRARSRIRHELKTEEVAQARRLGQEILQRDLRRRGVNLDKLIKSGELTRVARELSHKSLESILQAVAYGRLTSKEVIAKLGLEVEERPEPEKPGLLQRVFRTRRDAPGVQVDGMDQVVVRFAGCCSPVPGDPVEGFITRGRGVTVHTRDCPRVFHLDPARRVPVNWSGEGDVSRVRIRVESEDRPGLLAAISNRISAEGVNIQSGQIHTSEDKRAIQIFELDVRDRKHLDAVMRQLTKIKGVRSVERVRG